LIDEIEYQSVHVLGTYRIGIPDRPFLVDLGSSKYFLKIVFYMPLANADPYMYI